jgi:hypothetical protein
MKYSAMTSAMPHATTFAQPEVRTCFAPHDGHASAFVLTCAPHSLHFVIAISVDPPVEFDAAFLPKITAAGAKT